MQNFGGALSTAGDTFDSDEDSDEDDDDETGGGTTTQGSRNCRREAFRASRPSSMQFLAIPIINTSFVGW